VSEPIPAKPGLRQRLNALFLEYGRVALWAYFGIFAVVLLGFAAAISLGFHDTTTAGNVGIWGAAYVATKLTQPLRIAATLALTPLLMKLARARKPRAVDGDQTASSA
jgi:hypothetical protein